MIRFKTIFCTVLISLVCLAEARAFSLIGPFPAWQTQRIGYQLAGDLGGPMVIGEEYRLTSNTITYGFEPLFLSWFGNKGVQEVEKGISVFKDLGDLSVIDPNSFPLTSARFHASAYQLNLVDLKSETMVLLSELFGLAEPDRYIYTLSDLTVIVDPVRQYTVVNRNYDPITYQPSQRINGHLYTYTAIFDNDTIAFPIVSAVDPLAEIDTSVASRWDAEVIGRYLTTLTRDDVGGLKYLLRSDNYNMQTLPAGTTLASINGTGVDNLNGSSTPWTPVLPNLTNQVTTVNTNIIDRGLRGGVGQINFIRADFDSTFGDFVPQVVRENDIVITNGVPVRQVVERTLLTGPDLTFGVDVNTPNTGLSTRTLGFTNFDPLTFITGDAGPGAINLPQQILFNRLEPGWVNLSPSFMSQATADELERYGSFDGATPQPTIYPDIDSVAFLESFIQASTSSGTAGAWTPIIGAPITDPNATTQNTTP